MLGMIGFPMMIGLAVVAKPLVLVLLTEKWLPCVPYLQLLCVVGLLFPLSLINLNVLTAQGRSDLFFRLEVIKKILVVVAIAITYRWGIKAMIVGQIVTSGFSYYLNAYYTGKLLSYPIAEQARDLAPSLLIAGGMGAAIFGLGFVPFPNAVSLLIAQVVSGVCLYLALCRLWRLSSFMEALEIAIPKLRTLQRTIEGEIT
jgi:O-antigen/teichoic acid export membrane protein